MSSPFILNDNIICFIAFLDVFSTKNDYQKTQKKLESRTPPPYLRNFPKFYQSFLPTSLREPFKNVLAEFVR